MYINMIHKFMLYAYVKIKRHPKMSFVYFILLKFSTYFLYYTTKITKSQYLSIFILLIASLIKLDVIYSIVHAIAINTTNNKFNINLFVIIIYLDVILTIRDCTQYNSNDIPPIIPNILSIILK